MAARQAVVIISGKSRHAREAREAVPRMLLERGLEIIDTRVCAKHKDFDKAVRRALKDGHRLIVVCGGDGAQTRAVRFLAKSDATLGVVPAGTGNSFALGLGIPDSFEAAADAIAYGEEASIDLGTINDTYFANVLTIGLPSSAAANTSRSLKRITGALAYGVAAIVPILTHKPFRAVFRWKGHRVQVETHQIIIANGRYFGHQPLARDASLVDGRLTFFVRDATSRLAVMESYAALLRGDTTSLEGLHLWSTGSKVRIATKARVPVAMDGSLFCKTPIRVGVAPKALRVMVPSAAALTA